MKKILALAVAIALTGSVATVYTGHSADEAKLEYILQGATKATILDDINSVGGIVVQEYSLIEAVSVKLSNSQLAEIKKLNPMLRSFKDQNINVSSVVPSYSSENITFNVKSKSATWQGVNSGNDTVLIDSINLNMPSNNRKIKSIKVNGNKLTAGTIQLNGTIKLLQSEQIELSPGQSIQVEVKFQRLSTTNESDYRVAFTELMAESLAQESTVTPPVSDNLGIAAAKIEFLTDTNEVSWTVANESEYEQVLSQIKLRYPVGNTSITSVSINNIDVSFNIKSDIKFALTTPIAIAEGQKINVRIGFNQLSATNNESYEMALQYEDGITQNVIIPATSYALGGERDTSYPTLVRANLAHEMGITGYGVTVAIIDTGMRDLPRLRQKASGGQRDITAIDVIGSTNKRNKIDRNDENGHGTHLASIIANSSESVDQDGTLLGGYNGIAPDVNLVVIRAFDDEGQSSYLNILRALEYVVENKDIHNIKVLNLSFSALPSSYYWDDPLNQALMKAWEAGITVIAAAGNRGPEAMSIGVPGNTPYLITVGAVSDNYSPNNMNDDFVTSFSSAGPTYEGFVKPELVAPGGHIQGMMDKFTVIRKAHPVFEDIHTVTVTVTDPATGIVTEVETETQTGIEEHNYFEMSGSSQSTAVTTGIVALMLQANPNLSPDDIKCRLIETARVATTDEGNLAFSVFQQGAGLVDAMAAIDSTATGCGNAGLEIAKDLSGEEHYIGPARRHENDGDFYIPGVEGLEWSGMYSDSQLWRRSSFDADSQLWRRSSFNSDSQLWRHTSFESNSQLWRHTSFSADSQLWRQSSFDADSQLWRNSSFTADSQLWRKSSFDADSQLWRHTSFNSDSLTRQWVEHE